MVNLATFEERESEVRSYCRSFPTVFDKALGATLFDTQGKRYLDFFSGAGALNYGHNNPRIKSEVLAYLEADGVIHSLDMATAAKSRFLERFVQVILAPRGFDYKIQFPGPTGTNAVEAALKLARKVTGRKSVVFFTGAFHGMTLGALSVSSPAARRQGAGIPLDYTSEVPFESDIGGENALQGLQELWREAASEEIPAAVIVETIQAEGGVRAASRGWLRRLREITRRHGVLLIVDDIQVGCGRTGTFFSFEDAEIEPDLVCLSKSISGLGLPMALLLIRPEFDQWRPGEHNGTFRGQNLSFVAATSALSYWEDGKFAAGVRAKEEIVRDTLETWVTEFSELNGRVVGRGLIQGLAFADPSIASRISRAAFERGLVIECAGPLEEVLKLLPALSMTSDELREGLGILGRSLEEAAAESRDLALQTVAG